MAKPSDDPDDERHAPLVDSRQAFLEMCQFRYYQFDSLRRAKYSSLKILQELHNPHDLAFRPLCSNTMCSNPQRVIRTMRWHCDQCPNYDVCTQCYYAQSSGELFFPLPAIIGGVGSFHLFVLVLIAATVSWRANSASSSVDQNR